jgi:endonuclease/exonuclease/phosphatase (EEP) superfamily protein YafD
VSVDEQRRRSIVVGLLEAALFVTAIFSVATTFDFLHRFLELFSHFRLQYFVSAFLLTTTFIFLRRTTWIIVGLGTFLLNAWFVVPWYLAFGVENSDDSDIKLLHANVLVSNDSSLRFIALVNNESPDIVVMQEATPRWMNSIGEIDALYPYKIVEDRDDPFGIALYSKFPFDSISVVESEPFGYPEVVASAIIGRDRLNIISSHPMPPIGRNNYAARNLQLEGVARLAATTPGPLILVGDLNISMWAAHYRRFEQQSGLSNARKGFGIEPTWPLFLPIAMIPIDHALVSDDIAVTGFDTAADIGSDHLPVVVNFRLRRQN